MFISFYVMENWSLRVADFLLKEMLSKFKKICGFL